VSDDRLEAFRELEFVESSVPPLDALSIVVVDGTMQNPDVERFLQTHPSRWYPVDGGHRILVLYEGGPYDRALFTLEPKAWDHDHCAACNEQIPAMTLCWVTTSGKYVALCIACKATLEKRRGGPTRS
jgi:hypothetical protein